VNENRFFHINAPENAFVKS